MYPLIYAQFRTKFPSKLSFWQSLFSIWLCESYDGEPKLGHYRPWDPPRDRASPRFPDFGDSPAASAFPQVYNLEFRTRQGMG